MRDPTLHGVVIRLNKIVADCGLAESTSDAVRKIKQNAVRVNGKVLTESNASLNRAFLQARDLSCRLNGK